MSTENPNEPDTGKLSWEFTMASGDTVTITVDGYREGASVIRALHKLGHPDTLVQLCEEFANQGDMSMAALALELGAGYENKPKRGSRL